MNTAELTRLARQTVERAIGHLSDPAEDTGTRVHEARKCFKEARAILRLGRYALDGDFGELNGAFRDASRALAPLRENDALSAMAKTLREWTSDPLERRALAQVVRALGQAEACPHTLWGQASACPTITFKAHGEKWLERGLRRAHRAERRAFREAHAARTPEAIHQWRKRVKDLWYQTRIVDPARAEPLHQLSRLLGDHHDLWALGTYAAGHFRGVTAQRVTAVAARRLAEIEDAVFAKYDPRHMGAKHFRIDDPDSFDLDKIDPDDTSGGPSSKDEARQAGEAMHERLAELQELLFAGHEHKLLVVLQGMDTSGKDGVVRHVMRGISPASVRAVSFKKPTETELDHDYLWRVHPHVPGKGEIVIFNRSHYEDVLVPRVHDLVPEKEWKQRYEQINDFERMLAENGVTILKFFLHISRKEQRERLQARLDDPTKRWKFQHGDLDERKLWDDYQKAYHDALRKTSTAWAPWYVIPSNRKWFRDYVIADIIIKTLEKLEMQWPQPDVSKERVE